MLSNTAEMKPSPKRVCQEAAGSFSTGIIEAQSTSESRKTVPLKAPGSTSSPGARSGAVEQDRQPDRDADEREAVGDRREVEVDDDVGDDRRDQDERDDADARPVDQDARGGVLQRSASGGAAGAPPGCRRSPAPATAAT